MLPVAEEGDTENLSHVDEKEVKVEVMRAGGAGGQVRYDFLWRRARERGRGGGPVVLVYLQHSGLSSDLINVTFHPLSSLPYHPARQHDGICRATNSHPNRHLCFHARFPITAPK